MQEPSVRYGGFEFRTVCSQCKQSMPVNGPLLRMACARCGADNHMTEERIAGFLERMEADHPHLQAGQRLYSTATGNQRQWRCAILAAAPRCGACGEPFPVDQMPVGADEERTCGCGEPYSTYPAPAWLKRRLDTATQVYLADRPAPETRSATGGPAPQLVGGPSEAIVMACPGCAAGLEVSSETDRHADCPFCGAKVELPPVLWRKLHPLPRMRTWYVRFEGPSVAMKRQQEAQRLAEDKAGEERERAARQRRARLLGVVEWIVAILIALIVIVFAAGQGDDPATEAPAADGPTGEAAP